MQNTKKEEKKNAITMLAGPGDTPPTPHKALSSSRSAFDRCKKILPVTRKSYTHEVATDLHRSNLTRPGLRTSTVLAILTILSTSSMPVDGTIGPLEGGHKSNNQTSYERQE